MSDFVVYHKSVKMGYPALDINNLAIYTNKKVTLDTYQNSRIWLIAGEGSPRKYFLRATFRIGDVIDSDKPEFQHLITGTDGQLLDPMPDITNEKWFPSFIKTQGNFSFGFNLIKDSVVVKNLSDILRGNTLR